MTAIELLAAALPHVSPPEDAKEAVCCILGTTEACIGREHAIKPSFTNLDLLRSPDSPCVSVRAWRVMTEPSQRQSSWSCDGIEFAKIDRKAVRAHVLSGVNRPQWAGYVTTSYKKHGALRAPVNVNGAQRWLFETDIVDCSDRARVETWWGKMRSTREAGIPRPVIESLDCSVSLMRKHGPLWRDFEAWARDKNGSVLYRFLTYLLLGEEEIKAQRETTG